MLGENLQHTTDFRRVYATLIIPELVTGRFEFVHNVKVSGMLHGRVVRPPAVGAKLTDVDEKSVQDVPGFVQVVVKNDFVGVVADKPWQAVQAAEKLRCTWSNGAGLPSQRDFYDSLRHQTPTRDRLVVDSKDVDATLAKATSTVSATYHHPYQMHGSLGSSCAVADVKDGKATIWSASQAVHPLRQTVAMMLDPFSRAPPRHVSAPKKDCPRTEVFSAQSASNALRRAQETRSADRFRSHGGSRARL